MDIEVTDAVLTEKNGSRIWHVVSTVNGLTHHYAFPHDVFHWRAAEYGIDPEDKETLLGIVLHEPHLDHNPDDPKALHVAATIAEAREHHLARIRAAKNGGQLTSRKRDKAELRMIEPRKLRGEVIADSEAGDDPIEMIKRHMVADPGKVTAMRAIVVDHRAQTRD